MTEHLNGYGIENWITAVQSCLQFQFTPTMLMRLNSTVVGVKWP